LSKALHFHLVNTLSQALGEIFYSGKHADRVISKYLGANRKWGSRDRKFFAEGVYEIVRHKRKLEFIAESEDEWDLIGAYLVSKGYELPNRMEFDNVDVERVRSRAGYKKDPEIEHSFPDWLSQLGKEEFGETEWLKLMENLNKPAEVFLRANALKTTADELIKALKVEEVEAEKVISKDFELPFCLKLKERKNVFITEAFKKGSFEMQDAASQLVAPLLQVEPGHRVVDACAGAGGKSLHIASMMKNKGKIIAMDIHDWKLKELRDRCSRAGVDILETKLIDSNKTVKRLENSFDRVLLDVPCSGLGVLRRNPDTKWKLTMDEINRLQDLQKEIISKYSEMAKVGGVMVYATCSILNRENEQQVQWFLNTDEGKKWNLIKELRVWPHKHGFDGFYAAVLKKGS
jgi:16S rRNA (cytosine967-C5)-methyltransferase